MKIKKETRDSNSDDFTHTFPTAVKTYQLRGPRNIERPLENELLPEGFCSTPYIDTFIEKWRDPSFVEKHRVVTEQTDPVGHYSKVGEQRHSHLRFVPVAEVRSIVKRFFRPSNVNNWNADKETYHSDTKDTSFPVELPFASNDSNTDAESITEDNDDIVFLGEKIIKRHWSYEMSPLSSSEKALLSRLLARIGLPTLHIEPGWMNRLFEDSESVLKTLQQILSCKQEELLDVEKKLR